MTTTRLGVRDKDELGNEFKQLFGRCYAAMKCPIPDEELPALHNNLVDTPLRKVVLEMTGRGYDCSAWFSPETTMKTATDGCVYTFHLGAGTPKHGTIGDGPSMLKCWFMQRGVTDEDGVDQGMVPIERIRMAFGERFDGLMTWADNYGQLVGDCEKAFVTLSELLDMVNTAGQLKRMVPEMIQYVSEEKRKMLQEQTRSSALPYEWAAFERKRVYDMLTTMSKCWMMPPGRAKVFESQPSTRVKVE